MQTTLALWVSVHCTWRIGYDGFPIASTGQYGWAFGTLGRKRNCLLEVWQGYQQRDCPIHLIPFHCKLDCWIYTVDMIQKSLFVCLLLDYPCVIHKPKPCLRGLIADAIAFLSKLSMYCCVWLSLYLIPFPLLSRVYMHFIFICCI